MNFDALREMEPKKEKEWSESDTQKLRKDLEEQRKLKFIGEHFVYLLKSPESAEAFKKFSYIDMAMDCIKYPHPFDSYHSINFHTHEAYKAAFEAIRIIWNMILTCEQSGIDIKITSEGDED